MGSSISPPSPVSVSLVPLKVRSLPLSIWCLTRASSTIHASGYFGGILRFHTFSRLCDTCPLKASRRDLSHCPCDVSPPNNDLVLNAGESQIVPAGFSGGRALLRDLRNGPFATPVSRLTPGLAPHIQHTDLVMVEASASSTSSPFPGIEASFLDTTCVLLFWWDCPFLHLPRLCVAHFPQGRVSPTVRTTPHMSFLDTTCVRLPWWDHPFPHFSPCL